MAGVSSLEDFQTDLVSVQKTECASPPPEEEEEEEDGETVTMTLINKDGSMGHPENMDLSGLKVVSTAGNCDMHNSDNVITIHASSMVEEEEVDEDDQQHHHHHHHHADGGTVVVTGEDGTNVTLVSTTAEEFQKSFVHLMGGQHQVISVESVQQGSKLGGEAMDGIIGSSSDELIVQDEDEGDEKPPIRSLHITRHESEDHHEITIRTVNSHSKASEASNSVSNLESMEDGNDPPVMHLLEYQAEETEDENDTAWNQNNCIVCNVVLDTNPNQSPPDSEGHTKLKKFFLQYLGVNQTVDLGDDQTFPFCFPCADDLDKLMTLACKIEFMDTQFEKLRDNLARKTVKTFLCRTRPDILEEDVDPVIDNTDEPLDQNVVKPLINPAEALFNQWKRQYEMIVPGRYKKFPTLMKTVDPKQRVSYYRIDATGKHHFIATVNPESQVEPQVPNPSPTRGVKRKASSVVTPVNGEVVSESKRVKPVVQEVVTRDDTVTMNVDDTEMEETTVDNSTEDERQHKCNVCLKSFNSRSILNYHSRTHSGERPFKCNVCEKTFAQRGGLATHSLVHSGEKPYHCEDCGKSFRQKYHLTQHQLIHSGLKPFSCEICHKSFNVKMNLREHMRRHTGERPYRCPYCPGPGFFRKKMLRDHIVKSHPERSLPTELQTLGPTPKFPKSKHSNTKLTAEDLQRVLHSNSTSNNNNNKKNAKMARKPPESRLLIKSESHEAPQMVVSVRDDNDESILGLPRSTATLISINLNQDSHISQLNVIESPAETEIETQEIDQSNSQTCTATLELIEDKQLSAQVNLGPPEPILTQSSDSCKDDDQGEILTHHSIVVSSESASVSLDSLQS